MQQVRSRNMSAPNEESMCTTTGREEQLEWQEEKKQWIIAAGVGTPTDLKLKIEDMRKVTARNEINPEQLTYHLTEVKTFLLQISELGKDVAKLKKRCKRSAKRKQQFRGGCCGVVSSIYGLESGGSCTCVASNNLQSPGKRAIDMDSNGSLLDPHIMKSFRNLIRSSAVQQ